MEVPSFNENSGHLAHVQSAPFLFDSQQNVCEATRSLLPDFSGTVSMRQAEAGSPDAFD
jgi:hypothetical protein